jgi:hypothetical protein
MNIVFTQSFGSKGKKKKKKEELLLGFNAVLLKTT